MSIRGANFYSVPDVATKTISTSLNQYPNNPGYVRPADWPALTAIPDGTQKISVLVAIFPSGGNFLAFIAGGNYTVDWGDGTSDSASSGVQTNHTYDYNNVNLSAVTTRGYKCATVAITPTGAANLTSTSFNIRPAVTGINASSNYQVPILEIYINAPNMTTFNLGNNVLKFNLLEQVTIQQNNITSWSSTFFSNLNALQQLTFLKSSPAPFTGNNGTQLMGNCWDLRWLNSPPVSSNCSSLQAAFSTCNNMVIAPYLETPSVVSMNNMFFNSPSIKQVPLYNTANVTDMNAMFSACPSLQTVPLFNTAKVTTMISMFDTCRTLQSVPLFNTANVLDMTTMFNNCNNLRTAPNFNTAKVTNMTSMFSGSLALKSAPAFTDTSNVTTMSNMFVNNTLLANVPAYNTSNVTIMTSMFSGCQSLQAAPAFTDTSKVTTVTNMFLNCYALKTVPSYNLANATVGGTTMIATAVNLSEFGGYNINQNFTLPAAALSSSAAGNILANLSIKSAVANTLQLALNPGIPASVAVTGVASTAGTAVLTISNTTGLVTGMTAISANINSGIATTANTGNNAITLTAHNLVNNTIVSFSTAVFTVGTAYTPLYVVNAATNTFQVANTIGGTALTVTANATPVMNYGRYISAIVANTSVTLAPGYASNTGNGTVNFRTFDTTIATLKNWTVSG